MKIKDNSGMTIDLDAMYYDAACIATDGYYQDAVRRQSRILMSLIDYVKQHSWYEKNPKIQTLLNISEEVVRAREKFPDQDQDTQFKALIEEVGEYSKAMLEGESLERQIEEAIQIAAMAIRLIEGK